MRPQCQGSAGMVVKAGISSPASIGFSNERLLREVYLMIDFEHRLLPVERHVEWLPVGMTDDKSVTKDANTLSSITRIYQFAFIINVHTRIYQFAFIINVHTAHAALRCCFLSCHPLPCLVGPPPRVAHAVPARSFGGAERSSHFCSVAPAASVITSFIISTIMDWNACLRSSLPHTKGIPIEPSRTAPSMVLLCAQ